jgi:hypothetical protein
MVTNCDCGSILLALSLVSELLCMGSDLLLFLPFASLLLSRITSPVSVFTPTIALGLMLGLGRDLLGMGLMLDLELAIVFGWGLFFGVSTIFAPSLGIVGCIELKWLTETGTVPEAPTTSALCSGASGHSD